MNQDSGIKKRLEEYVGALTGCATPIDDSAELASIGVDSISLVKILVFAERSFGAELADAELGRDDIATFGALAAAVERLAGEDV